MLLRGQDSKSTTSVQVVDISVRSSRNIRQPFRALPQREQVRPQHSSVLGPNLFWLRGQDSNLRPIGYTYPIISNGVDYIITLQHMLSGVRGASTEQWLGLLPKG